MRWCGSFPIPTPKRMPMCHLRSRRWCIQINRYKINQYKLNQYTKSITNSIKHKYTKSIARAETYPVILHRHTCAHSVAHPCPPMHSLIHPLTSAHRHPLPPQEYPFTLILTDIPQCNFPTTTHWPPHHHMHVRPTLHSLPSMRCMHTANVHS